MDSSHSSDTPESTAGERVFVLLVDDAPANLLALRAILDDLGCVLVEVNSGEDALERAREREFAAVLLAVRMPGLSGFDTAKLLRADARTRHTPVMFLSSADAGREEVEAGYALGAVDFLVRPLSPAAIRAKVRGFVTLFREKQRARQEAEQLRLIVQGTTDYAIFMLDPHGRVATWNSGAERLKGYRPDEIVGRHFSQFYPQDVIDRGWPDHELTVATAEGRFEDEGWRIRKDGSRFWANVVITALRDERGQLRGFSKVTRDLTERKRAEEALRRSEERFRHMVEGVRDYAIFMLDQTGHVATWNAGAERIKQYRAEEIIGRHFSTFYPQDVIDRGWPDHELKVASADGRFEDEGWRVRKDGTQFWANVVITAIKDDHGDLLGFTKVTRDLTARRQAEEDARRLAEEAAARRVAHEERERLRVTLASIGDAVISTDAEGRVEFLNPVAEALVGWPAAEAAGRPLDDVFHIVNEQTRRPVETPVKKVLREGVVVGLANHTVLVARDGAERPIDDSAAPIRDAAGNVVGVVLVFRDVSEPRRAERELRASETRKAAILETALDCVIAMDHAGKVVEFNPAAERTFGYARSEVVGRDLAEFLIPPRLRERYRQGMARYLATGDGPVLGHRHELPALRADGTETPVEVSISSSSADGPPLFTAYLRDISDRKTVERHRNARLAVTQVLSTAAEVRDGASGVLQAVCENLGWDVGFFWAVNGRGDRLDCLQSWHDTGASAAEFEEASRRRTFAKGEGLPGRVWATARPAWIMDLRRDGNFPRLSSAVAHGLHSAFACPVAIGHQTLGVIEFFSRRVREADADLLELMGTVAGNVGQFIERRTAEQKLRQSEAELSDFFENATVGLHWVGPDGIILRANQAELDMLGYSRDEYVGRPIADFHIDEDVICDILRRLQSGEKLHEYPARLKCKDGSIKHVLIDSSVMFRDGGFVHTRCFTRDVTERRRGEALLVSQKRVLELLVRGSPLPDVLDALCEVIEGQAEDRLLATVLLLDEDGKRLRSVAGHRAPAEYARAVDGVRIGPSVGSCGTAAFRGEPVVVTDIAADPLWADFRELALGHGLRACWSSPIRSSEGRVLGTFAVYYPTPRGPTDGERRLVDILTRTAGVAIERRRAETAIREQEQRTRAILESISDAFFALDRDWRFTYLNRQAERLLGRADLLGKSVWEEFAPAVGTDFDRNYRRAVAENVTVAFEAFYPPHDRWYEVHAYPSPDGLSVYFRDATERRRAEAALRASEERFRQLADVMPQIVWTAGPDGQVDYLNRRWTEYTGRPQETGNAVWRGVLHPDDGPPADEQWAASVATGRPFEAELRLLDGGRKAYRWHLVRTVAVRAEGGTARWFGTATDIHAQKRGEQTARFLSDASAALAVLVDFDSTLQKVASLAVPHFADWAAVDVLEADGALRRVGVAHVDPVKVQVAHDLHRRFPPDPAAPTGVWNILRTGTPELVPEISDAMLEASVKDPELLGILRELGLRSYIGVPLAVRGKTLGVLTFIVAESGHAYDATDLAVATDLAGRAGIAVENAHLYQELREADRRKDEFIALLAHELRNPLAPIGNGLQVLRLAGGGGGVADARAMMERQLAHMVRLVDDLLDVSRISRNKLDLRRERVALGAVIQAAVETSRPLIEQAGHTLSVDLSPTPVYLDADPVRMAQVFSNLLTNAAKYTEPGGRIALTAEQLGAEAVVRVRDTGLGIPAEALPRIFEMFAQVDRNMERSQGGLGIGLTLVRRLAEMHGGRVEAFSDGPGKGSEFVVRLPVLADGHERVPVSRGGRPEATGPGRRILVVDDNQDAAESLGMMLTLMGHEVRTALDGLAAVEAAEAYRPDVILLDIGLPKLNGYDACRRLRERPWASGTVIVALTGWGQEEDRRRSQEAGFDRHLVKPLDVDVLVKLLSQGKR